MRRLTKKPVAAPPSVASTAREPGPRAVRIVRRRLGGRMWEVVRPFAKQPSAVAATQADAEARARELLANAGGGQLLVHDSNGTVVSSQQIEARPRSRPTRG